MKNEIKIFTGNANPELAGEICQYLRVPLGEAEVGRFPDGETEVKINENVRGLDCFVVQPTSTPANENLMELLLLTDALHRASAAQITAVIPYYGYGRADRKSEPRVPISAKLIANLITASGVSRVVTMDLHAGQIQGFFDIPVDHLYANPVLVDYFLRKRLPNLVVVSPDAGGVERARAFAKRLKASLAIVDKRRVSPEVAEVMHVVGDVKGKTALIIDDLVDTAGTLCNTAEALKKSGALKIYAGAAHGVLAGTAMEKIEKAPLEELVITNSIRLNHKRSKSIVVLSVAKLLGEAIRRIHTRESVSALFV